jgi:hypothetical protein
MSKRLERALSQTPEFTPAKNNGNGYYCSACDKKIGSSEAQPFEVYKTMHKHVRDQIDKGSDEHLQARVMKRER